MVACTKTTLFLVLSTVALVQVICRSYLTFASQGTHASSQRNQSVANFQIHTPVTVTSTLLALHSYFLDRDRDRERDRERDRDRDRDRNTTAGSC